MICNTPPPSFLAPPMPRYHIAKFIFCVLIAMKIPSQASALDVLFIGNSFTHIPVEQTHANGSVGMPAIFTRLAEQGGYSINVSMDAPSGRQLQECLDANGPVLSTWWDVVVLQDVSFQALEPDRLEKFHAAITALSTQFRNTNPRVDILLYQTWSYPAMLPDQKYGDSLDVIQHKISAAYQDAATRNQLAGVVPVGEAFLYAFENDLVALGDSGSLSLWGPDNYHQSVAGAYLTSVLFYHRILGEDISSIPTGTGSVAAGLGFTSEQASLIHQIASAVTTAAIPESSAISLGLALLTFASVIFGTLVRMPGALDS